MYFTFQRRRRRLPLMPGFGTIPASGPPPEGQIVQPYQFFTPIPQVTAATTRQEVKDWFCIRRAQVLALGKTLTIRSAVGQDAMDALWKKLGALENQAGGNTPLATVVQDFQQWLVYPNDEPWDFYVAEQQKLDAAERARQLEAARVRAIDEAKQRAVDAAIAETTNYGGGLLSERGTGRVIAGLALVNNAGVTYTGISGVDMHTHATHPVIDELLRGTNQAEDWPQISCAEVDALKSFLHAAIPAINSVAQIPRDTLVFHARVWNPGGSKSGKTTTPHWQARGACKNCSQWVAKIGALLA
jgi:hypothetical protein